MGLITPLLCEAADGYVAVRWVRERPRLLTQGAGTDLPCLSTQYTGCDHTEGGLKAECCRGQSAPSSRPCCNPYEVLTCGSDEMLYGIRFSHPTGLTNVQTNGCDGNRKRIVLSHRKEASLYLAFCSQKLLLLI